MSLSELSGYQQAAHSPDNCDEILQLGQEVLRGWCVRLKPESEDMLGYGIGNLGLRLSEFPRMYSVFLA